MTTAWERAVEDGDVEAVRELVRSPSNVDARDRYGQTALMLAAHRGRREIVEILIASGADLDVTAKYNLSALMLAIVAGHAPIARLLARAGANLSLRGSGAQCSAARLRMISRLRAGWTSSAPSFGIDDVRSVHLAAGLGAPVGAGMRTRRRRAVALVRAGMRDFRKFLEQRGIRLVLVPSG